MRTTNEQYRFRTMTAIDINCDMGESFGNWTMGRDAEVMPYITSANIAGGYHAGDPHVMRETVSLAAEHDVGIGIHPGLPDKMGFGRRSMDATPEEVRDYVVYQLGALMAFANRHGASVQHVKPHGAMYSMLSESEAHCRAVMEALLEVDPSLVYLATDMKHLRGRPGVRRVRRRLRRVRRPRLQPRPHADRRERSRTERPGPGRRSGHFHRDAGRSRGRRRNSNRRSRVIDLYPR